MVYNIINIVWLQKWSSGIVEGFNASCMLMVHSWDRKNNPEPWNKMAPTDQYKVWQSIYFTPAVWDFSGLESSAQL